VQLNAGANKIIIANPNPGGYAPGLDSITVAPVVGMSSLQAAITKKTGRDLLRVWQLSFINTGGAAAKNARINSFSLAPVSTDYGCKAAAVLPTPLPIGTIPAGATRKIEVPIVLSPFCRTDSTFRVNAVFSADNGAT